MAFLLVGNSSTISVAPGGSQLKTVEVGDRHRAFSGEYRSTVIDTLRSWDITTTPLTRAVANTLYTTLTNTVQPSSCSGDLLGGSVDCFTKLTGWHPIVSDSTHRVVVTFSLEESS